MPLTGLVVPALTLFGDGGKLDLPKNSRFSRSLIDDGVRHILVLGTSGEATSLTAQEREALLERAVESCTFGTDVWATILGETTQEAVNLADAAEATGCSVLAALPPPASSKAGEGVLERFRAIHAQSKLPLLVYRTPDPAGARPSLQDLEVLAGEGVIQGILDTSGNAEEIASLASIGSGGLAVFGGDGAGSLEALAKGAKGIVWEAANVLPRLASRIWEAQEKGQTEKLAPLLSLQELVLRAARAAPSPSSLKFLATYLRESDEGYRAPHLPLSEEQKARVVALVEPQKAALQEYA